MSNLALGLLSALLATNPPLAVSNLVQQQTGVSMAVPNPNDPETQALDKVMEDDDAAMDEVDRWIRENQAFAAQGGGESRTELNRRIRARLDLVRAKYEDFLKRYPNSARGHLAYGTFLNDIGEEEAAVTEYQKSRELDPNNPAVWNNLANYYGEFSPVTNAFVDYAKAIELDPTEPVYYENFATTVYLFRKDAEAFFHLNEQQVFDKALDIYRQAMKLAPEDFTLATDYAESYYGIKPLRTNDALAAWTNALNIAHNDFEREGVLIHLARVKIAAGRFAEAQAQLDAVTNAAYADLKQRLERNLVEREKEAARTNALAAPAAAPVVAPLTNAVPALPNAPPFSATLAKTTTNVPPDPPSATNLSTPLKH